MTVQPGTVADTDPTKVSSLPDGTATTVSLPTQTGRYRMIDELARGGMGVIYRATDTVLDREVALKTLQDWVEPGSAIANRFVREARISGQLQHPGIPPVHDLGTLPDGRPFLAMKLIKGRTLDELLEERSNPTADRGRFLAAFEQVCQAVAYAHNHGVIHRDLKPPNVMVGAYAEVQVMDWGLAKLLASREQEPPADDAPGTTIRPSCDTSSETQAGSVLGTPAFMPPEQAIGAVDQLDTRSDVFGLGAILCVVLTGQPPYLAATAESTRQLAARAKLDETLQRLDSCGADPELVALCKRCLRPDKPDRPANAGEVAKAVAALRAAAEDRARQAELDRTRVEVQAAEQRKRRVVLATAAAVAIAALAVAALVSLRQAQVARTEADNARNAEAAATAAEGAEKQERATADEVIDYMQKVLAYGTSAGQGGKDPKTAPTVREALDRASQGIAGRFKDRPLVEAKVRKTVGEVYFYLRAMPQAAEQYERVLEIHRAILGPDHETTWGDMNNLGTVYLNMKKYTDAESLLTTVLAAKRAKFGDDNKSTQTTVNNLGNLYASLKQFDKAEPLLREAYEKRRRLLGPDDEDYLKSANNLGALRFKQDRPKEAEPFFREAAEGYERKLGVRFGTAQCWSNVADAIHAQKRFADAVPVFEKALGILDRIPPEEGKALRAQIAGRLNKLYTEWDKPEEAAKWAPQPPPDAPREEKRP